MQPAGLGAAASPSCPPWTWAPSPRFTPSGLDTATSNAKLLPGTTPAAGTQEPALAAPNAPRRGGSRQLHALPRVEEAVN